MLDWMRTGKPADETLCGALRDDRGSALIEFSILIPLAVLLVLGVMDYSFVIQEAMVVTDAATNGTRYAVVAGNSTNVAGMLAAAEATALNLPNFTATASNFCTCPPSGAVIDCMSSCASGDDPAEYAKLSTSASVPLLFKVSGFPASIPLTASSSMRVTWNSQVSGTSQSGSCSH
jgi:Flp pilus assembly protein TadG